MDVLFSVIGISMLFLIDIFFCSSQIGMANNNIFVFQVQSSEVHNPCAANTEFYCTKTTEFKQIIWKLSELSITHIHRHPAYFSHSAK